MQHSKIMIYGYGTAINRCAAIRKATTTMQTLFPIMANDNQSYAPNVYSIKYILQHTDTNNVTLFLYPVLMQYTSPFGRLCKLKI